MDAPRTPDAPPWLAEVEDFALGTGAADAVLDLEARVLAAIDGDHLVGVAIHRPHDAFRGAQLLSALLIVHGHRGRGLGRTAFALLVEDALATSNHPHLMWLTHERNETMRSLSDDLVGGPAYVDGDHLVYVYDR